LVNADTHIPKEYAFTFFTILNFCRRGSIAAAINGLPDGYSEREPPDPFPNSEVKTLSADDSVGLPHVKVGHCQALILKTRRPESAGFLLPIGFGRLAEIVNFSSVAFGVRLADLSCHEQKIG
jgi:hypothetical protein